MVEHNKDADALKIIIRYCDKIQAAYTRFGALYDIFRNDDDYQSSCAMYIFQIGELSAHLSANLKSQYTNIPWREIVGMRNVFAHDYGSINLGKLWETITNDISPLRSDCLCILTELGEEYDPDDFELHSEEDGQDNGQLEL
jgi:uncharacterized protein with HEPN domain